MKKNKATLYELIDDNKWQSFTVVKLRSKRI